MTTMTDPHAGTEDAPTTASKYSHLAQTYWMRVQPVGYQQMFATPTEALVFFRELGSQIAGRVHQLEAQLDSQQPPAQEYLDRVRQLTSHRSMAEELVLEELLYSVVTIETIDEDLQHLLEFTIPDLRWAQTALDDWWSARLTTWLEETENLVEPDRDAWITEQTQWLEPEDRNELDFLQQQLMAAETNLSILSLEEIQRRTPLIRAWVQRAEALDRL